MCYLVSMKNSDISPGYKYLIGVDEVGRGPIAGPVAVGAFVIPIIHMKDVKKLFRSVKESKQLTEVEREMWFKKVLEVKKMGLVDYKVTFKSEKIIDARGLSHAIKSALERSVGGIEFRGNRIIPDESRVLLDGGLKAPIEYRDQKTIIKGDEKEMVIALASICAKVLRDRKMVKFTEVYPGYSFHVHKGYGTKAHYGAIKKHGMCPIHRRSFLGKV